MSTVRIPPVLRPQTGGVRDVSADGTTVGEVLHSLTSQFPGLTDRLFQDGSVQKFVNVYLNDQDISYLQGLDTPATGTDTIIILPAMAGGH